jgi:glycine betaine/proline transport system ATP-binding protein
VSGLRAEGLFKIFGRRSEEAVRRLKEGATPEELKRLGVTCAVIDASFEVAPGEIFVVMGLSGSGKSTLIRMLNGLLEPTDGHVYVDDRDVATMNPTQLRTLRRERMSMVFQHFALLPHRTVIENAAYALRVRGLDKTTRQEKAREALSMVGLEGWEDKLPQQLSGGMKQRVGLARALAAETEFMLMDEAFSALDPLIRREMQDQLLKLQASLNKTIIFITHDLNEAMRLGDRIAVMRAGRIVQIGTAEQILQDPANDYVAQFVQDVDRTRVLTASSVMEPPRSVVVDTGGPRAALREMRQHQSGAAFVISRDRRLRGTVTEEAAVRAMDGGGESLAKALEAPTTVSPDSLLAEVFAPSAESPLPVAVVDADDRLVGVIPRGTLLAAMASLASGEVLDDSAVHGTDPSTPGPDTALPPPDALAPEPPERGPGTPAPGPAGIPHDPDADSAVEGAPRDGRA